MSASIRELGGQMLLPGEEVDFDQEPEVPVEVDGSAVTEDHEMSTFVIA